MENYNYKKHTKFGAMNTWGYRILRSPFLVIAIMLLFIFGFCYAASVNTWWLI